ncbi:MAG: hypothetical protein ACREON_14920 [Gemmatimonadaceae bacterium]
MIDARTATPEQIRRAGIEVLARELGVVGMVRFLQQFDPGVGDYTRDRHQWLGNLSVDELFDRMERKRQAQ